MKSRIPVLLSTSSVFPEPTAAAFELAATLGYDGIEVMVWTDAVSQDAGALRGLSEHYGVPVVYLHSPYATSKSLGKWNVGSVMYDLFFDVLASGK